MLSDAEKTVLSYLTGEVEAPQHLRFFVSRYQKYDTIIRECVSYPKGIDTKMNMIYDTLVQVVSL